MDDNDFSSLNQYKWYAQKHRKTFYAKRNIGKFPNRTCVRMHNQILAIKFIDHKNRNGLDNRKENLRPATNSQNHMNRGALEGRRFKGPTLTVNRGKPWQSKIEINGKKIHLGYFKSEEEAARAYDTKARDLFGEYARTNL